MSISPKISESDVPPLCPKCGRGHYIGNPCLGRLHPFCNICGWRKGGVDSWNGRACKCGLSEAPLPDEPATVTDIRSRGMTPEQFEQFNREMEIAGKCWRPLR